MERTEDLLHTRPLEVEVWSRLSRIYHAFHRRIQAALEGYDLSLAQYQVLRLLGERGAMRAGELAEALGVTPGALTGLLDRLEAQGLLSRGREEDRRALRLELTPKGRALYAEAVPRIRGLVRRLFAPLGAEGVATLLGLLERLEVEA